MKRFVVPLLVIFVLIRCDVPFTESGNSADLCLTIADLDYKANEFPVFPICQDYFNYEDVIEFEDSIGSIPIKLACYDFAHIFTGISVYDIHLFPNCLDEEYKERAGLGVIRNTEYQYVFFYRPSTPSFPLQSLAWYKRDSYDSSRVSLTRVKFFVQDSLFESLYPEYVPDKGLDFDYLKRFAAFTNDKIAYRYSNLDSSIHNLQFHITHNDTIACLFQACIWESEDFIMNHGDKHSGPTYIVTYMTVSYYPQFVVWVPEETPKPRSGSLRHHKGSYEPNYDVEDIVFFIQFGAFPD